MTVPEFVAATPSVAATQLDNTALHVWRLRYAAADRRTPFVRLLAAYAGLPVSAVRLREGSRGKPLWADTSTLPRAAAGLAFNWSHSGDYALFAIARGAAIGVDLERFGKPLRTLEIARRFFDPGEADALAALSGAARERAFIRLWCAKEAVLKSIGAGLSFGLERVAFAHRTDGGWLLARTDPDLGAVAEWQLTSFAPTAGYHGALAWRGVARRVSTFAIESTQADAGAATSAR